VCSGSIASSTRYPVDYGFIPNTLADDDDPLDAMVIVDEPTFSGCHITCRSVGVLWMHDEHGLDVKILSVPAGDSRISWTDLPDVPDHVRDEIRHFFEIYKDLEPGKTVAVDGWRDRETAEAEIRRAAAQHEERASEPANPR
jgi:inorganic pyrophosphatase